MINPESQTDRGRLSKAMKFWYTQHSVYRDSRAEGIKNYIGTPLTSSIFQLESERKPLWGNLIQLSGIAHQLTTVYNVPTYKVIANLPEVDAIAPQLQEFLNRYVNLLDLGSILRAVSLDSFFGYGIFRVDHGLLPPAAMHATGVEAGPRCWRVSQDDYGFDGSAKTWDQIAYHYSFRNVPLQQAQNYIPFLEYNPDGAQALTEYSYWADNEKSRVNDSAFSQQSAMEMTRLIDVYFPHSNQVVTWPANQPYFAGVEGKPLLSRDYKGHYTGPYGVLSHLDIPDNLIPVCQNESVRNLHFLFNDLMEITANQATSAKYNPVFEVGNEKDMNRIMDASDRTAVPVSNINKIGSHTIPGPDQSQTAYLSAALGMYKEFSGNLDDSLGLGPTAKTARQSQLINQANSIRGAEAKRRTDAMAVAIGVKLSHLALQDQELTLRYRREIGRSGQFVVESKWRAPTPMGGGIVHADDFSLSIAVGSMQYRSPQEILQEINEASGIIFQAIQMAAGGAPINVEAVVEMQAEYRNLPQLRKLWIGLLPQYAKQVGETQQAIQFASQKPNGNYTRENVSERSNQGGMIQALTQSGSALQGGVQ